MKWVENRGYATDIAYFDLICDESSSLFDKYGIGIIDMIGRLNYAISLSASIQDKIVIKLNWPRVKGWDSLLGVC
jgi:hypothetical protein